MLVESVHCNIKEVHLILFACLLFKLCQTIHQPKQENSGLSVSFVSTLLCTLLSTFILLLGMLDIAGAYYDLGCCDDVEVLVTATQKLLRAAKSADSLFLLAQCKTVKALINLF